MRLSTWIPCLLLGLLGACGGADEPAGGAPAAGAWTSRSLLPVGQVPASFEKALVVHGGATLRLEVRGRGRLELSATLEQGSPRSLGRIELGNHYATSELALPGQGDRALRVRFEGPDTIQWARLELVEPAPGEPPPSTLAGSLKGRNVVIFLADSLAAGHTTIHGYGRETTPFLGQLAEAGLRFEAAHSQTSWTVPSVTSLFTAQTQERHGMLRMNQQLPEGIATLAQSFQAAGYETVGLIQNGIIWSHTRLDRGFDQYHIRQADNEVSKDLMSKARELMSAPREKPLFLYVHLMPPHMPYTPPERFATLFVDPEYDGEVIGSIMDCAKINYYKPPMESADVQHLQALYDGHIRFVDNLIEQTVEEALRQSPREDWLIVVTSDHGEAFLQHGEQGHNSQVYQEMIHIPLVLAAPGSRLPAGGRISTPVSLLDLGPTLRDLVGVPAPDQIEDGRSLLALLEHPGRDARRPFFFSSRYPLEADSQPRWTAVRLGDWKLLRHEEGPVELYDLARDPLEQHDRSAQHPIRTAALRALLEEWRRGGVSEEAASAEIPADALEQLQRLGYVDSDGDAAPRDEDPR